MPQDDTIKAQTADGMTHEFPAGTPKPIIDAAIKKYVISQNKTPETPQHSLLPPKEQWMKMSMEDRKNWWHSPVGQQEQARRESVGQKVMQENTPPEKPPVEGFFANMFAEGGDIAKGMFSQEPSMIPGGQGSIGSALQSVHDFGTGQLLSGGENAIRAVPFAGAPLVERGSDLIHGRFKSLFGRGLVDVAALEAGRRGIMSMTEPAPPSVKAAELSQQKINQTIGVKPAQIRVGKMPSTMEELSSNPARVLTKNGLDAGKLSKMSPFERNATITKLMTSVGQQLDATLEAATKANKVVNLEPMVRKVFAQITDKPLQMQVERRLEAILQNITSAGKPLSQFTPIEARALQRGLDDFANFAPEGQFKSFRDVATSLRRGISAETRKVVPESAPFDQDYTDLVPAKKAVVKQVQEFATKAPVSKLRNMIIRMVAGGAGVGAGSEILKKTVGGIVP